MEKKRVEKGGTYFVVKIFMDGVAVSEQYDSGDPLSNEFFLSNNYFTTREEAEAMANKLRAVLAGADVIQMPSEDEIEAYKKTLEYPHTPGCDYMERVVTDTSNYSYLHGFQLGINWLKSKIIK